MAMFVKPPQTKRIKYMVFSAKTEKDADLKAEQVPSRLAYYQNKEQRKRLGD